jgi:predicted DsbA family dithiol-disulfide isomerase
MSASNSSNVPTTVKIDFVSDVVCPWCVIGLRSLEQALQRLDGTVDADIHFQPFELNPGMAPEGEDIAEHIRKKYGSTPEQFARNQDNIRERGKQLGFDFRMDKRSRTYNTFDAHRLLHWAELEGKGRALKHALFDAYFTDGENISSRDVLLRAVQKAELSATRAAEIIDSSEFADDVRKQEKFYLDHGVQGVPAVIVNDRHLISGGHPPEIFEQAIRQIAGTA